jgi:hypothetical protein
LVENDDAVIVHDRWSKDTRATAALSASAIVRVTRRAG